MDPTRSCRSGGYGSPGGDLKIRGIIAVLTTACISITSGPGGIAAIEVDGLFQRSLQEGDTLSVVARAVDANNQTVTDAQVIWELLDVDSGQVGLTIDETSGLITAGSPGIGRVQASVASLRSGIITITVVPAPDSIAVSGDSLIMMAAGATSSPNLTVVIHDLTTFPDSQVPLAGTAVRFSVTAPAPGGMDTEGFFLTQIDTVPGATPHEFTALTDGSGQASIVVRLVAGSTVPDTTVVEAVALTAIGDTVPGAPVLFVIAFPSN